jgi:RHS repeat-associated protein
MRSHYAKLLLSFFAVCFFLTVKANTPTPVVNAVPDNVELAVLKDIYDNLGGINWTTKTNWPTPGNWPATATSAQLDTWYGITVVNGDITQITLKINHLAGALPSSLGNLSALTNLDVGTNAITGVLPESLKNCTNLLALSVNNNVLAGSIPSWLTSLTKLQTLDLSTNQFTGSIPQWLGGMTTLTTLKLNNNTLTGSIPTQLGQLINLTILFLNGNNLTGEIPVSLANLTKLIYLYVNNNGLSGAVPSGIGNIVTLKYLSLNDNQLSGSLPASFSNLSALINFYALNNNFSGTFPSMSAWTNLTLFNISNNLFSGAFPASVSSCTKLTFVTADHNSFTSLPAGFLNLPVFIYLMFDFNKLNSVPNFSLQVNKANLNVYLKNNQLDFQSLEPSFNAGIKIFRPIPQDDIADVSSVPLVAGQQLLLQSRPTGTASTVIWEKKNAAGAWVTLTNDQDNVPQTYTRTSAAIADEGVYRWRMTNTIGTGLTVQSTPTDVKSAERSILDTWAFQYKYDARKRMIKKKVPGADWVYMVYDDRDRLVLTQDGEQRKVKKWSATKYDALNRPVITGIYTHAIQLDQEGMSALIDKTKFFETYTGATTNHGYTSSVFPTTMEALTVTYYDNYNFISPGTYAYQNDHLSQTVNGIAYTQDPQAGTGVAGLVTGGKVKVLDDNAGGSRYTYLNSVTYYDDRYRPIQTLADNYKGGIDKTSMLYDFTGKVLMTKLTHSTNDITWKDVVGAIVIGNKIIKTVTNTNWGFAGGASVEQLAANTDGCIEWTALEVSTNNRMIGLSHVNADAGATIDYSLYLKADGTLYRYESGVSTLISGGYALNDVFKIERTGNTITYKKNGVPLVAGTTVPASVSLMVDVAMLTTDVSISGIKASFAFKQDSIVRTFDYDHAGRLLRTWHKVDAQPRILLAQNEYNELGQLIDKKLYSADNGSTFKQSVDYRYNIRGWLTSINDSQLIQNGNNDDTNDLFGMNLLYEQPDVNLSNAPQYNGNISAMKWSTNLGLATGATEAKERAYNFTYDPLNRLTNAAQKIKTTAWTSSAAFKEGDLQYDLNGNIRNLNRTNAQGAAMDALNYTYCGNQLLKVDDASGNKAGFTDGYNTDSDYSYDDNGNLKVDQNKAIQSIQYNHLNLPQVVTKTTGEHIRYIYDATGRKLNQSVYNASDTLKKTTGYEGEFFYENDSLKFVNHEEGRVVMSDAQPEYQYHMKDHLGNVRLSFTTKQDVDSGTATMEDANASQEQGKFLNYLEAVLVDHPLFDHTSNGTTAATYKATRLVGGNTKEKFGLERSLSVMPGDQISMEVYAKYLDPQPANWQGANQNFLIQYTSATPPAGSVIDGGLSGSIGGAIFPYASLLNRPDVDETAPKAFLTWLVFDRDFNLLIGESGFVQIATSAKENGMDVPHQLMARATPLTITQPGYVYIYLSNENPTPVEVYFDDFKVEHTKSPVIQMEDYYPFGLTFNSYRRENSVDQNFKFNGKEEQTELDLGWLDFGARMYQPEIGKWISQDPLADERSDYSPYNFVLNNPISRIDPDGMLDDYAMNTQTGAIGLIKKTDDATDRLVDAKDNTTVIADKVDKGLLSDGQNIKQNGLETTKVNGGTQLAKDISFYTSEEIVGVAYQNESGGRMLEIRAYAGQTVEKGADGYVKRMTSGADQEIKPSFTSKDGSFTGKPTASFHTHPGHPDAKPGSQIGTPTPSSDDIGIAIGNARNGVSVPNYIFGKIPITLNGVTSKNSVYTGTASGSFDIRLVHPKKK